jgi:hypothetical protein
MRHGGAGPREALQVGGPGDVAGLQLVDQGAAGERAGPAVAVDPGAAAEQGDVVGQGGVADGVVVGEEGAAGGQAVEEGAAGWWARLPSLPPDVGGLPHVAATAASTAMTLRSTSGCRLRMVLDSLLVA